jgi:hypothetical protein
MMLYISRMDLLIRPESLLGKDGSGDPSHRIILASVLNFIGKLKCNQFNRAHLDSVAGKVGRCLRSHDAPNTIMERCLIP